MEEALITRLLAGGGVSVLVSDRVFRAAGFGAAGHRHKSHLWRTGLHRPGRERAGNGARSIRLLGNDIHFGKADRAGSDRRALGILRYGRRLHLQIYIARC